MQGDKVTLKVNKLTSTKTQLPYDYYSIWFCRPEHIVSSAENLGEVLRGDRIENSPYEVSTEALWSMKVRAQHSCTSSSAREISIFCEVTIHQKLSKSNET